jgi:sn-glycerol 3-phosphate transport system substrate-binding protein
MKKRLFGCAVLTAGLVLVAANVQAQSKKTEVTFLYGLGGQLGEAVRFMAEAFNKAQDEVEIKPEFANNYEGVLQKALAGIAAGAPAADLLQLEVALWPRLAQAGQLAELSQFEGFKTVYDTFWPVFRNQVDSDRDGKVFAMPWNNSNPVLYYNPDLLKKAGVGEEDIRTYPKLREAAKKIKAATGANAINMPTFPWVMEGAVWSNGGEMLRNNKLALGEKAAIEVLETWAGIVRDGSATAANPNDRDNFAAGKLAMYFDSVAGRPGVKAAVKNFKFRVAPLPYFKKPFVPVGGATLAISKGVAPEKQQAAWKFIRWLTTPQQQFEWIKRSNYVPITRTTSDLPEFKKFLSSEQGLDLGMRQLPFARPRPSHPGYPQFQVEVGKTMEGIYLQNQPVEASIKAMIDRLEPAFK